MREEIPWNTWGSFGINLALGNKLDAIATEAQYMYLPNYVFQKFKVATRIQDGKKINLVKREEVLLKHSKQSYKAQFISPLFVFGLLSLLGLWITYKDYHKRNRTKWFDFLILFTSGVIGVFILFLWFFTDHATTPNNFNFLWAFAPNLLVAFLLLKKKSKQWFATYFKFVTVLLISMLLFWILGIQSFPYAIFPFLVFLIVRYVYLQHHFSTSNQ